jgi:hypothetical protein
MNKENKVTQVYTYRWLFWGEWRTHVICLLWSLTAAMASLTHDPVIVQQQQQQHYM